MISQFHYEPGGPINILLEVFIETFLCGLVRHSFYKYGYLCFRMHFRP